jgi:MATE family multidrug resistance protein
MPVVLLALSWRDLRPHLVPWRDDLLDAGALRRMLAIGLPIGTQMMLEYGVFAVAGVMMGWIGTAALAGHQVALNLASLTFMVPLGVSSAAAVLVGSAIGRGDMPEARRAAAASFVGGVSFMVLSATAMLLFPGSFARLYSNDAAVVAVAATLLPIAGVFQVFDGLQVVSIGVLRGAADTRAPMLINVLGFWLMGLPVSWWLGVRRGLGPAGLWWGLTLGLIVVAGLLVARVRMKLRGDVQRVTIDAVRI